MDFFSIVLFLFLYFIRPQDWIGGLEGARLVTVCMGIALIATFTRRQGFSLKDLFRTPHDYMMWAFFVYVIVVAADPYDTFREIRSFFVFYAVTLLALTSIHRLGVYLAWWTGLVLALAAMAVGSVYGFDLTGAKSMTEAMEGRLVLNTWMHRNPNALGHTVIVAIPMLYFLMIWRKPVFSRVLALPLLFLTGYCVYLTESKGAYLVGFVTIVVTLIFGRPRMVQLIGIVVGVALAVGLLSQLPRMEELSSSEEGILGRLMAWEIAQSTMEAQPYGVGWNNFRAEYNWQGQWVVKPPHSAYVQIGAALGYLGLFLYLGIIYCGFRTLVQARTRTVEEERCRRMLFTLLFSFACSGWMIDRAYHTEFFLIAAAIAAFHRLTFAASIHGTDREATELSTNPPSDGPRMFPPPTPAWGQPALATASLSPGHKPWAQTMTPSSAPGSGGVSFATDETVPKDEPTPQVERPGWNRLGLIDLALIGAFLWFVLWLWDYTIKNF